MTDPSPVKVLSFGEAVRKRPGMYVGDAGQERLQHLIDEVVSNAIDQYLHGAATMLSVRIHDDQGIEVSDDGCGLPFDEPGPDAATSRASAYLQLPHFTASAHGSAPHVHLHSRQGAGLSVVNHLSAEFSCRSWRDGRQWEQRFVRGEPQSPARVIAQGEGRGTTFVFRPIGEIVGAETPDPGLLRAALWKAAYLFGGLKVRCGEETFHAPLGLRDYLHALESPTAGAAGRWKGRPLFHWRGRHGDFHIDAAAGGFGTRGCSWHSWVNGRATPLHGSHVDAFAALLKQQDWTPATAVLHVVSYDPSFAGPTRDMLKSEAEHAAVQQALADAINDYCQQQKLGRHSVK